MKSRKRRWALILTAVLLVVAVITISLIRHASTDAEQSAPRVVRTEALSRRDVPVYIDALGTVTPTALVTVRTQVQGTLASIDFKEGQRVQRGELLARVDDRELRAQLESAEGALQRDIAQRDNARRDLARVRSMVEIGSASAQQLDAQQTAVHQAEGAVKADAGTRDNLRVQLGYTRITAPVDGILGLRQVDAGNLVSPSDANGIVTVASTSPTTVKFAVPVAQLTQVLAARRAGDVVVDAFDREGGKPLAHGKLTAVDNRVDDATGTVMLRARFDDPDGKLYPNQFVSVRTHVKTLKGALVVPLSAIRHGRNGAYVFVLDDGKARLQNVDTGPSMDDVSVVSAGGLKPGTPVVVEGVDALEDGVDVRVANAPSQQH